MAESEGATVFDAALALFEMLVVRYTREDDFVVGVPADARTRPELDDTVGVLLNTVVVRSDVVGNPTFRTLLGRVRDRVVAVSNHADLPFEALVRQRQPQRDLGRHPLFQVMVAINPPEPALRLPGIESEELATDAAAAGVDLFLFLQERPGGLDALWEYSTDLFSTRDDRAPARPLRPSLEAAVAAPDVPIDELSMLSEDERRDLLTRRWVPRSITRRCRSTGSSRLQAAGSRTPSRWSAVTSASRTRI